MTSVIRLGVAAALVAAAPLAPAAAGGPPNPQLSLGFGFGGGYGDGYGNGGYGYGYGHGHGNGGVWVNGGEWARYNNRTFESDSFNDWWHDRPDRAYPAWMRSNQECQKLWYAGSTLRC